MIQLENPNGVIQIRFDGFLSCLLFKRPRAVDWPDWGGSVARYFACLPMNELDAEFQLEMERRVSSVRSVDDLVASGFLDLLETGSYELEHWEDQPTGLIYNTNLFNSNPIIHEWHKSMVGDGRGAKPYALDSFYPFGRQLMFTQPFETLDQKRIQHYEDQIRNGARPLAVAIRACIRKQEDEDSYQDTVYNSTKYILDGHHKLVAYQKLNINPSYLLINRRQNNSGDDYDESVLPILEPYFFFYQLEDIVNHGLSQMKHTPNLTQYVDAFLSKTPRVTDDLIRILKDNWPDDIRKKWLRERLAVLKNRLKNKSGFYFDYYNSSVFFRKYEMVKSWDELENLMKQR